MARRRNEGLLEVLSVAPWWISVALALTVYIGCQFAPTFIHSEKPILAGLNAFVAMLPGIGHWFALPFVIVACVAAFNGYRRRRLLDSQTGIESIRNLSWQEFELLVGESFRRQGFSVDENGGGGADGGIDLRVVRDGKRFVVQCKRWKTRQVGVSPIRELFGLAEAEDADGAIFVSSGTFTRDAEGFADANGVTLISGPKLLEQIELVRDTANESGPRANASGTALPSCPRCGSAMELREARRGSKAGEKFWGCVSFPKCRGTLPERRQE